jgi:WD40 repeat protein
MLRVALLGLGLLVSLGSAGAAEIEGTVREASGGKASIVIPFDVLPNVGDKVDFFSLAPGTTDEVPLGSGSVSSVSPDAVLEVKIEQAISEISKDNLVRIHTEATAKPGAVPSAVAPPAPIPGGGAPTVVAGGDLRSFDYDPTLIWDVAFSPDGTVLASGFHDGRIALWDVDSGKSQVSFRAHDDRVFQVTFSPDGSLIASAGGDKSVALRDGKSGEMKRRLEGHTDIIEALDFTPDGTKLASGSADNTIRIWNVQTGELLRTIKGQSYTVSTLDFSPDGALIASAGWADGVTIWNVATGEKAFHFSEHPHYVDRMTFAPDWSRAATATDNLLKIWDTRSGELLHTLEHGPADWEIDEVRFSPDSSLVVSADEHAVKMWDAASGALRLTITEPMNVVTSVVFSPDGSGLAIGGGAIKTFDLGRGLAKR